MDCNIIEIIPGLFISDSSAIQCEHNLNNFNINYLINLNGTLTGKSTVTYGISYDTQLELIDSSKLINIDFNKTNDFIVKAMQSNSNILICNVDCNVPLMIAGAFLIKYLNLSFIEAIYYIAKKINMDKISKNICYQLFLFFTENENSQ